MRKKITFFILAAGLCLSISCKNDISKADYRTIPLPQEVEYLQGKEFLLDQDTRIIYTEDSQEMQSCAHYLKDAISESCGFGLEVCNAEANAEARLISLSIDTAAFDKEAYQIVVSESRVDITGGSEAGVFHGIQTLRKSLPLHSGNLSSQVALPQVKISDYPRFQYRGLMLDVARHYFSTDEIKQVIDLMAIHQMNTLHWHLTDDQGWRIEIKKYPKLTSVGAYRDETVIGRNSDEYDGKSYGGFYTQEEIRDIVSYASERYITIIPEIDMPGHMLGALASYPYLGCTGGPYKVWGRWGISEDVLCVGKPRTMEFVKDVLDEVMELFPSQYIHLGGDECPKSKWEVCQDCQKEISRLGLRGTAERPAEALLQSHFMTTVENYLNAHGRKIIGWDEILEGGMSDHTTIMAWRGVDRGIEAVKKGHDVIMTPTSHLYFDYYQSRDIDQEPLAIGGFVDVERVYGFEPSAIGLEQELQDHILGVQANMWTEYIISPDYLEYMLLPRLDALSEVQWCIPENKDYDDFLTRIPHMLDFYSLRGLNFAGHLLDAEIKLVQDREARKLSAVLSTVGEADILYTTDGSDPLVSGLHYEGPLNIQENTTIKAVSVRGDRVGRVITDSVHFNKATFKPISLLHGQEPRFSFKGAEQLNDGVLGDNAYGSGRWLGFINNDLVAVIDMEGEKYSKVSFNTCLMQQDWVFDTRWAEVQVSDDGHEFHTVAEIEIEPYESGDPSGIQNHILEFPLQTARYVKVTVRPENSIPDCHCGKGAHGFVFVDEIEIY